uniref:Virion structural protein n=4 Tax=unclassified bacterial viruses TaxID=12333 RepID=A0AAU6W2R2_9VIRU
MSLRGIANRATQRINPNIEATLKIPNGYTIDPATRKQIPGFTTATGMINVQALDSDDLKQILGLNMQGSLRAVYLYNELAGLVRPDQMPNAEMIFSHGGQSGTWGIFKVLETWQNWRKVAVVYQDAAA